MIIVSADRAIIDKNFGFVNDASFYFFFSFGRKDVRMRSCDERMCVGQTRGKITPAFIAGGRLLGWLGASVQFVLSQVGRVGDIDEFKLSCVFSLCNFEEDIQ